MNNTLFAVAYDGFFYFKSSANILLTNYSQVTGLHLFKHTCCKRIVSCVAIIV